MENFWDGFEKQARRNTVGNRPRSLMGDALLVGAGALGSAAGYNAYKKMKKKFMEKKALSENKLRQAERAALALMGNPKVPLHKSFGRAQKFRVGAMKKKLMNKIKHTAKS